MHKLVIKGESLEEKRNKLIALIDEFCGENKNRAIVVFDAHQTESLIKSKEKQGSISIIYSAKGETADDVIIELLKEKKPKSNMLVSSDNYIRKFADENGFNLMKSEEFVEYLT